MTTVMTCLVVFGLFKMAHMAIKNPEATAGLGKVLSSFFKK
ncbi:MAG: hypothetical protein ACRC8S_13585 [Fimbriiglobus sp.]